MIHLASVLIATDDVRLADEIEGLIHRNGYKGHMVKTGGEAFDLACSLRPDLVIVAPGLPDTTPIALGERIRRSRETSDIPVFMIVESLNGDVAAQALAAGIDDVMALPMQETILMARLRPLVRLATMHAELRERAATAKNFGITVKDRMERPEDGNDHTLLLVGSDTHAVAELFGEDADIISTASPFDAETLLGQRNFDAAVLFVEGENEPLLDLCSQIRHNPRLFNLPVLLLTEDGRAGAENAYRRGASRVLPRVCDPEVLKTSIITLVRRQKLRWAIRKTLMETLAPATSDGGNGLYNIAFLNDYLAKRVAHARESARHLSVIFFNIPSIDAVRDQFGDEAAEQLRIQCGQWIGGLLRGEDLTARYHGNEFCVVLPDTLIEEANVVMHRIAGVLSYTDFAVPDVYQPVTIWVQVGSTDVGADDSTEAVIERARRNLN